jgi:hypothetical protein
MNATYFHVWKKWRQSDQNLLPKETKWHGTVWWGFRSFPNCNRMFEHKKISSFQSPIWHFHNLHFGLVCRSGQSVWKHTRRVPRVTVQTYFSRKILEEEHRLVTWSVLFLDIALGLSAYYPQQLNPHLLARIWWSLVHMSITANILIFTCPWYK